MGFLSDITQAVALAKSATLDVWVDVIIKTRVSAHNVVTGAVSNIDTAQTVKGLVTKIANNKIDDSIGLSVESKRVMLVSSELTNDIKLSDIVALSSEEWIIKKIEKDVSNSLVFLYVVLL